MKKYLITNNYSYYDDFEFCNICVVDTLEKAEELVKEYNKMKEDFKSISGYILYSEPNVETPFEVNPDNVYLNTSVKNIFLTIKETEDYIDLIDEYGFYKEESNYFEFLSMKRLETLECRLCNNIYSVLRIEEIKYIN